MAKAPRFVEGRRRPLSGDGKPRRWKAPWVRPSAGSFARARRRRPYKAGHASAGLARWFRSREAVTARPSECSWLSGARRHGVATVGVRVSQVGVNPARRAVVVQGVERAEKPERPLAWGNSVGGVSQEALPLVTRRFAVARSGEVWTDRRCARGMLCCRSRQAACGPDAPVKAGTGLGLAFGEAGRESVSEAGPRRESGHQWRPGWPRFRRKPGALQMGPVGGRRLGPPERVQP